MWRQNDSEKRTLDLFPYRFLMTAFINADISSVLGSRAQKPVNMGLFKVTLGVDVSIKVKFSLMMLNCLKVGVATNFFVLNSKHTK